MENEIITKDLTVAETAIVLELFNYRKDSVELAHRIVLYLVILTFVFMWIQTFLIFLAVFLFICAFVYTYFYDHYPVTAVMDSFTSLTGYIYILHKTYPQKCRELIHKSKNEQLTDRYPVKLVFFVPTTYADAVRKAMGDVGAGKIGNYSHSSWSSVGYGRCIPQEGSQSKYGEIGKLQTAEEERIETLCDQEKVKEVINVIKKVHPYEEVNVDIFPLIDFEDL